MPPAPGGRLITSYGSTGEGLPRNQLERGDFSHLDLSSVENVAELFRGCQSLREVDLCGRFRALRYMPHEGFMRPGPFGYVFLDCDSLERWRVTDRWPVRGDGIPTPIDERGWWSQRDGRWMSEQEIAERGPVDDTYSVGNLRRVPRRSILDMPLDELAYRLRNMS